MQVDARPGSVFGFRRGKGSDNNTTNEGVNGHAELEDEEMYWTDKSEYLDFLFMFYNY